MKRLEQIILLREIDFNLSEIKEILKEEVYVNRKFEKMIEIIQYIRDITIIEVGLGVLNICGELIGSVKA